MNMNMLGASDLGSKMMNRFFRKVDGVVWDIMSGRIGIKGNDGIVSVDGVGDDAQVTINMMDQFGMEVPAFAQNTPVDQVKPGDMIFGSNKVLGWVIEKKEKSFVLLKADGTRSNWAPPKVQMLGFDSGVLVLRSLMNMLPGGQSGLTGMQSMLMPLMMMGGDSLDLDSMMPMLLMSQMGVPTPDGGTTQPLGGQNMMQMLMFSQMMKQMGGSNPSKSLSYGNPYGTNTKKRFIE